MFNFFKGNYTHLLLAMLITTLGVYCYSLKIKLDERDDRLSENEVQIALLKAVNTQGEELVKTFSSKFEELAKAERVREEKVKSDLDKISTLVSRNVTLSNKLLASTPGSSDLCVEADKLINSYLDEIKDSK